MYYIYVDEAGTSANEPVTVVVGFIVHADHFWHEANNRLVKVLDQTVPSDLREGFHFHATDIWSRYRNYDDVWSRQDRLNCIASVASIPRMIGAAIALGKVRRDAPAIGLKGLKEHDLQHILAFRGCVSRADKYIQEWGEQREIATVVAEDVPEKRRILKKIIRAPVPDFSTTSEFIRLTVSEKKKGVITQSHDVPIMRLVDTPHFVEKREAPLLQIADACAFSFRRYFSELKYGEIMALRMLGMQLEWEDWQGPASHCVFSWDSTLPNE